MVQIKKQGSKRVIFLHFKEVSQILESQNSAANLDFIFKLVKGGM